jgi:excisionase family DNA binding protein
MSVDMSVIVCWADTPKPKNPHPICLCVTSINHALNGWLVSQPAVHSREQLVPVIHSSRPVKRKKERRLFGSNRGCTSHKYEHYIRNQMTRLLTLQQVSTRLAVSYSTVLRLIRNQELAVTRIGRSIRISQDELERYIDAHTEYGRYARAIS